MAYIHVAYNAIGAEMKEQKELQTFRRHKIIGRGFAYF